MKHSGYEIFASEIMERVRSLGELNPLNNDTNCTHNGPAERYQFKGAKGEIGFIRPMSHHFCYKCNRLRLTASGQLRTCLLSERQADLKTLLRSGCSDNELAQFFVQAVHFKPMRHTLSTKESESISDQMSAIGG
jgi:cyclic pyranopterin phosphate synthase